MKIFFFVVLVFVSLSANAEFADKDDDEYIEKLSTARKLVQTLSQMLGQTFYVYYPRQSCHKDDNDILRKPNFEDTSSYTSAVPQRVLIEAVVPIDELRYSGYVPTMFFYRLKIGDRTTGFLNAAYLKYLIGDQDSISSLENDCWFKLNPQELESKISQLKSDQIAKQEAIEKAKIERLIQEDKDKKIREERAIQANLEAQQDRQKNAPVTLQAMDKSDYCVTYGQAMRDEPIEGLEGVPDVVNLVKSEARRRKLTFNDEQVKDQKYRIGISECQLYAARGAQTKLVVSSLKEMEKDDFCVAYGKSLRDEEISEFNVVPEIVNLVQSEAHRRKLTFNDSDTKAERVRMGISECQLYAARGAPREANRTVGKWGVHVQHVYNGTYIYTENGRVTSWQD